MNHAGPLLDPTSQQDVPELISPALCKPGPGQPDRALDRPIRSKNSIAATAPP